MSVPPDVARVRAASEGDVAAIAEFAGDLYTLHHAWDPARFWDLGGTEPARRAGRERFFHSQLHEPDTLLLVAEQAGTVRGYAYASLEVHDYEHLLERAAWLHDLYVVAGSRGTGLAALLFAAVGEWARAGGSPLLAFNVAEPNARAQAFFARHRARVTMREMVLELPDADERGRP